MATYHGFLLLCFLSDQFPIDEIRMVFFLDDIPVIQIEGIEFRISLIFLFHKGYIGFRTVRIGLPVDRSAAADDIFGFIFFVFLKESDKIIYDTHTFHSVFGIQRNNGNVSVLQFSW